MQHKRYREYSETAKPLQAKIGNTLHASDTKKGKSSFTTATNISRKQTVSSQGEKLQFYDKSNKSEHPTCMIARSHKNYRSKPKAREHIKDVVKIIPIVSNKKFKDRSLKFEDFDQPPDSTSTPVTNHVRDNTELYKDDSVNNNETRHNHILHGHILNEAPEPFKNWDILSIKGSEKKNNELREYHRTTTHNQPYQLTFQDRPILHNWDNITFELQERGFVTNDPHYLYKTATVFGPSNNISTNESSADSDSAGYQSSGGNATYNNSNG